MSEPALHVSNGDSTDVSGTGLAQRVLYWRDSLHEGPVPEAGPEELRGIRAGFLTESGVDDRAEGSAVFAERDRVLEAGRAGEYPGIARFGGLGELRAEQLRELPDERVCGPDLERAGTGRRRVGGLPGACS